MVRVKRTGTDVLEVSPGTGKVSVVGSSSPVVEFRNGLTRLKVSNDSGHMEIILCGKGSIEAASLSIDSTYVIDEFGLKD